MKIHFAHGAILGFAVAPAGLSASGSAVAAADPAAQTLMKKNACTKCHAADKDKVGPSYKKVAAKYKGKPDSWLALCRQCAN